jgi:hypothetical protein
MQRKYIFIGLALVAILAFAGFAFWGGNGWDHESVTRVVPGENGETLVITDDDRPGFFPFFPFLFIPLLWFLVIGGIFSFFGRRRWGDGPPFGPDSHNREAWLDDWHRRQHSESGPKPTHGEPDAEESASTT